MDEPLRLGKPVFHLLFGSTRLRRAELLERLLGRFGGRLGVPLLRRDAVLPVEGAVAAKRDEAHRKELPRLLVFMFEERGTEADGKFVDAELQKLADDVVPEFVHRDHRKQNEDGEEHGTHRAPIESEKFSHR